MSFSAHDRVQDLNKLSGEVFDLVIIGGGITGAGVARDAASRGMKVALLEARDFAEGTSSRSSKLIHGGIRYLENFEFKLVFEALSERALLFEMAPHLVHPLRFVIPIYESSRVGFWTMGAGMMLYDLLAAFEMPEAHCSHNAQQTTQVVHGLNGQGLKGSFEYSDAYMDDDRLVIETLRSARQLGALAINYCAIENVTWQGETLESVQYRDQITGQEGSVRAKQFVSAVGPWTDIFGDKFVPDWKQRLRPTKGIHITLPHVRLPLEKAVVMAVEKRIIFVIPRHEMVIVGTTDTDFQGDPADVEVTPEDVQYLLEALDKYFPEAQICKDDIIGSYAGVRPLIHDGSESEGKTSREHEIFSLGENVTGVAGGKYTTYRKMAEDIMEAVLKKVSFDNRMIFSKGQTKTPLNPKATPEKLLRLQAQKNELAENYGMSPATLSVLIGRHGEEALELMDRMIQEEGNFNEDTLWAAEARFALQETCCLKLADFYWRRSPLFLSQKDHGLGVLPQIADEFQKFLGWSDDQKRKAIEDLQRTIDKELNWK